MAPVGVLVRFEAKPDMLDEVEALLTALAGQVQPRGVDDRVVWVSSGTNDVRCVPRILRRGGPRDPHDRGQ